VSTILQHKRQSDWSTDFTEHSRAQSVFLQVHSHRFRAQTQLLLHPGSAVVPLVGIVVAEFRYFDVDFLGTLVDQFVDELQQK
jgi:hypothetical protein